MNTVRIAAGFLISFSVALLPVDRALAQACEWDGERMICPVHPQSAPSVESLPFGLKPGWLANLLKPRPPKVDEALQRNLTAYQSAFHLVFESTRTLDRFAGMKAPKSRSDLDRRVQDMLETVWPEYRSQVAEYGLLSARKRFFLEHNLQQRDEIAALRQRISGSQAYLRELRPQVAGIERQVDATRQLETSLGGIALKQLNDYRLQRNAIATLLVFAPGPRVTAAQLDLPGPVERVPGRMPEPGSPIRSASLAPARARDLPPDRLIDFVLDPPAANAPLETKIAVMQSVGHDLQQMRYELPALRNATADLQAENRANQIEEDSEARTFRSNYEEQRNLVYRLDDNTAKLEVLNENNYTMGKAIIRELLIDAALDHATGLIRDKIDEIAGAEGLAALVPKDASDGLFKLAREGGKYLLPHRGYERQWETFVSAQEQTLGILDRSQGSILDAARLAATASPAEMEAQMEHIFASTQTEAAQYIKLIGESEIPEGESSTFLKAIDKYLNLRSNPQGE